MYWKRSKTKSSLLLILFSIFCGNNLQANEPNIDYWGSLIASGASKYSTGDKVFSGIELSGAYEGIVLSLQAQSSLQLNWDDHEDPTHKIIDLSIGKQAFYYNEKLHLVALVGIGEVSFEDKGRTQYEKINKINEKYSNSGASLRISSKYWMWEKVALGISMQRVWDGYVDPMIYSVSVTYGIR